MKKISLLLALAIVLVFGYTAIGGNAAGLGAATENNIYEVIVTANLRIAPSVEGQWLATVPAGTVLIRLGNDVSGYSLVDYSGQRGYIYTNCIREAGDESARQILDVVEESRTNAVEEITEQRMTRSGRDVEENTAINEQMITFSFAPGSTARRESPERESSHIAAASIAHLMRGNTIVEESAQAVVEREQEQPSAVPSSEIARAREVAKTQESTARTQTSQQIEDKISIRTNLRQTPGTESDFLAALPRGASVTVLGRSGGYAMVQYDGLTGYVLDDFVVKSTDLNRVGSHPVLFTITAYCPCRICCGAYSPEVRGGEPHTATGTIPQAGRTIAVDPSVIPYGSHVMIEGLGSYIAEDCGGAIKDNHIDLYFDTHEEAVAFGMQRLYVTVQR